MKKTGKEKVIVSVLLIVLTSGAYYQFVYLNQSQKVNEKKAIKNAKEDEYNKIIETISGVAKNKADLKVLNDNILLKSTEFYPILTQEKIILELDSLISSSGIIANIAFSPIEVASVPVLKFRDDKKVESTLKTIVDEYKNNSEDSNNEKTSTNESTKTSTNTSTDNTNTSTDNTNTSTNNNNNNNSTSNEATKNNESETVEQFKVGISFNGSYSSLKKFIESLETYNRKINIINISFNPTSETNVSGNMNIEFYGIPKLGDEDIEYLKWTLKNIYGKESPFEVGAANGAYTSTVEESNNKVEIKDFVMMLRSPNSDLPTLTIGKSKDSDRKTYIYSDNNKIEEVTIKFKEESEKLYYSYKTNSDVYPKDNNLGEEFKLSGDKVVLEVSSEARVGSNDTSGVKLKLINNTSKKVEVVIKNDDEAYPRIDVSTEGNSVNVIKK